jgi:hypothetical protein
MALPEHCVTTPTSPPAKGAQSRRRVSAAAALALALGCVISAPAVLAQSAPALTGKWQLTCTGRRGQTRQISLDIGQQGTMLSGTYTAPSRSGKLQGSAQGNQVSFELAGRFKSAKFTGTAAGNTLRVHTAKGVSCTGTRQ